MVPKQLIVAVEGTAAIGPFWQTIVSDYLDKIIRSFCGNEPTGQKPSTTHFELSLVMFNAHGSYSACLVQRSGWTKDMDIFFQWLSAIPFAGGGFNDAAIAEGLSEALMMFSSPKGNQNQNVEGQRHCILIAASNPYPLPTPVFRPQIQNPEKNDGVESQPDNRLSDAETLAKSFAECAVSLSVICPKQLPKLRGIFNAGKRNPRAPDPPVDNNKNPHFLVLISENFMEARSSLSRSGITSLPPNQIPVKMDVTPAPPPPISGPPPVSIPSVNGSLLARQPVPAANIPPAIVKLEPPTITPSMTGPTFPHISSIPRAAPQSVPTMQTSSPISTPQEVIPINENIPEVKPLVASSAPPIRPAGGAAANVRILNDMAQARQALAAAAAGGGGGASIGIPSMGGGGGGGTTMLSNMISSGMMTSSSMSSGPSIVTSISGPLPLSANGQVAQNNSGNSGIAMSSQPLSGLQGNVGPGQTGNIPVVPQMVQTGMGMNANMMSGGGGGASGMSQQGQQPGGVNSNNVVNTLNQQTSATMQSAQSKYVKVWEGNLSGQRQGQPVFITRLEGYRSASASETLAANWPSTMQIVRLISQDHMNNKQYVGKADFLVFRAMNQHGFLGQLQEKKLCAVIQLPSQTLLLSVSDKAHRLIGMLFPGDMVVFKPQIPNNNNNNNNNQQQQQQQMQVQLQQQQMQVQLQQQQIQQQQQPIMQIQQQQQQQQMPQMQQQQNQQQMQQQQQNQQQMNQAYMSQGVGQRSQIMSQGGQASSQGPPPTMPGGPFIN